MHLSIIPKMALRSKASLSRRSNIVNYIHIYPIIRSLFTFSSENDTIADSASSKASSSSPLSDVKVEKVKISACGDVDSDDDGEMEQEEMFVDAFKSSSFDHRAAEWGGPRRGGRLLEPTRYGDWERKGRCSDF
mmetsp:Transcript_69332/g.77551  ORF Transcript_69332/g.77551 Transcript_69332/m.77551 type:complete len:134 (-) Transcript_69332:195-596(-)